MNVMRLALFGQGRAYLPDQLRVPRGGQRRSRRETSSRYAGRKACALDFPEPVWTVGDRQGRDLQAINRVGVPPAIAGEQQGLFFQRHFGDKRPGFGGVIRWAL